MTQYSNTQTYGGWGIFYIECFSHIWRFLWPAHPVQRGRCGRLPRVTISSQKWVFQTVGKTPCMSQQREEGRQQRRVGLDIAALMVQTLSASGLRRHWPVLWHMSHECSLFFCRVLYCSISTTWLRSLLPCLLSVTTACFWNIPRTHSGNSYTRDCMSRSPLMTLCSSTTRR